MTFSFKCKKCGHTFEETTKYEDRTKQCPLCKGELKQQYSKSTAIWKTSLER
ncbi:hypothetical protein KC717_06745 [Candidatus Dojkabacteria bacterium]|uniref:Putative regulatory protein FmdB zinc ribbon domain-containing protein n=1 Tax=Candidatus Dojkabacteria bacterium TaxID=2099670 RepID=A0A955L905_9BACT|nr:hypothetical protein [Candidatus Dojkabacteria bacterium]